MAWVLYCCWHYPCASGKVVLCLSLCFEWGAYFAGNWVCNRIGFSGSCTIDIRVCGDDRNKDVMRCCTYWRRLSVETIG